MATLLELARGQNIPGSTVSTLLSPMGVEPVSTKVDSFTPLVKKTKAKLGAARDEALSTVNPTEFKDVSEYTEYKTGMKADAKRKALLPTYKDGEWTAPGIVHEAAKALSTTGAYFKGVPVTMEDMTNLAGSVGAASYGLSSFDSNIAGSTLGTFVGPKARNRGKDYNDVKKLSDLLDANVTGTYEGKNKVLYNQTGWFKGPDKKLRTEISDHAAKFHISEDEVKKLTAQSFDTDLPIRARMLLIKELHERMEYGETLDQAKASLALEMNNHYDKQRRHNIAAPTPDETSMAIDQGAKELNSISFDKADEILTYYIRYGSSAFNGGFAAPLSSILKHDELFDEYPELRNMTVRVSPNMEPNVNGSLSINPHTDAPEIILNGRRKFDEAQLSTLLHEIQHNIQDVEGFDLGTDPTRFMKKYGMKYDEAFDRYLQQHGEAEARMTEARQLRTPRERQAIPPFDPTVFEASTGVKLKDLVTGDAPPKGLIASESRRPKISDQNARLTMTDDLAKDWTESTIIEDSALRDHVALIKRLNEKINDGEPLDRAKTTVASEMAEYYQRLQSNGVESGKSFDEISDAIDEAADAVDDGWTLDEATEALDYFTKYGASKVAGGSAFQLQDIMQHDELFDKYPYLRSQRVRVTSGLDKDTRSMMVSDPYNATSEILLNSRYGFDESQLYSILHEVYKVVDRMENKNQKRGR